MCPQGTNVHLCSSLPKTLWSCITGCLYARLFQALLIGWLGVCLKMQKGLSWTHALRECLCACACVSTDRADPVYLQCLLIGGVKAAVTSLNLNGTLHEMFSDGWSKKKRGMMLFMLHNTQLENHGIHCMGQDSNRHTKIYLNKVLLDLLRSENTD